MTSLVDFLTAQLDADEAVARAAVIPAHDGYHPYPELASWRYSPWSPDMSGEVEYDYDDPHEYPSKFYVTCDAEGLSPAVNESCGPHIARHDPARVLREVEAKRAMIGLCRADAEDPDNALRRSWAAEILRALAAVYSDRPGWDEGWAVQ